MSKVRVHITVSADGYVAGPNQSLENPLGEGGDKLHEWAFALRAFREPHGMEGGEVNASTPVLELHNVPLVPGGGARFFEGAGPAPKLEQVRAVEAPGLTHLKYRVVN